MYNNEKQIPDTNYLQNFQDLVNADVHYMAILVTKSIVDFTYLDYLIDIIFTQHLQLAKDDYLNKEIENVLEKKFVCFSKKVDLLNKIAKYAGAQNFHIGIFIDCAGRRNDIAHGYYRIMEDENNCPLIYVIDKTKSSGPKISRPELLATELHNSIKQCTICVDEIFELMGLPKFGKEYYG